MGTHGYTVFKERTSLAGNFVAGTGYGIQLALYIWCVLYLWSQRKKKAMKFLLLYVTILQSLESSLMALCTWVIEDMYINHRNYPGGSWAYFLATQYMPENVLTFSSIFILTFLSDLLVFWRCWVIWNIWNTSGISTSRVAHAVTGFLTIILLASCALGVVWIFQSSRRSLYSSVAIRFGTAYYMSSLGVNILVTILITTRLVLYRREIVDILPREHAALYFSMASIFIESAALYSVTALVFIISYALDNPINQIFLSLTSACQISGYLIILRLAQGRAWGSTTIVTSGRRWTTVQLNTFTSSNHFDQSIMDIEARPASSSKWF